MSRLAVDRPGASAAMLLGLFSCLVSCGAQTSDLPEDPLHFDTRIVELLVPCERGGYYDRFVDDLVPILVEKLYTRGGDPLKRAKEELGELGERAAGELRRLFDENFADASRGPVLENVLDAAAMNDSESAHDLARRALDHPMETVRHRGLLGMLARHAQPADFEFLKSRVEGNEPEDLRRLFLRSLFLADAARAEAFSLDLIGRGEAGPLLLDMVHRIAESESPSTAEACARLFDQLDPPYSLWLAAPAAKAGDAAALEYLKKELTAEAVHIRLDAVRALTLAGRVEFLGEPLTADPSESVRVHALGAIAQAETVGPLHMEWISSALADGSKVVRGEALNELCRLGDEGAIDLSLSFLLDEVGMMQVALTALRAPLLADKAIAKRALEVLLERYRLEELRPLIERATTLKAIGLIPLPEAALFLHEKGVQQGEATIEGLRAHDWMMIHASNTGQVGRDQLWECLQTEADPLRRIDLIAAVASTRDAKYRDSTRERMLSLAEDPARPDLERLFAAVRAIKVGPSWKVAPRLRLLLNTFDTPQAQVALQCHLWNWY